MSYQLKVNRLDRGDYFTSRLNLFSIIPYSYITCGFRVNTPTRFLVRKLCKEQVISPPRYAQVRSTGLSRHANLLNGGLAFTAAKIHPSFVSFAYKFPPPFAFARRGGGVRRKALKISVGNNTSFPLRQTS